MSTIESLFAVMSSSLVSGVIGALVGGWFTLRGKQDDYANEYYKVVLSRRIKAYEEIDRLIDSLRTAVLDGDGRPYHLLFSKEEAKAEVYGLIQKVMAGSLWMSDDVFSMIRDLNILFYENVGSSGDMIEFGKDFYKDIADLRSSLEKMYLRDILVLHEVPKFLRSKRPADSYGEVNVSE